MRPRGRNNKSRPRGFTMIELMVVVVLIGVGAAMAAPMFTRIIPRMKTRADARNVLNTLRQARSRAITENCQYGVYFDSYAKSYILFKNIANPSLATYETGDSAIGAPVLLDRNVVFDTIGFANNCLVMLPTGAASQTGNIGINSAGRDAAFAISVLAATGKTKLQ